MVLTVSFALSPVIGLSCHRHLADSSAKLDAGVEASGPHDFAVRFRAVRPLAAKTSTASRPTFVTMANAPLIGRDGRICRRDLPDKLNEIFLRKRLDRPDIQPIDLPVGQISRRLASRSVLAGRSPGNGTGFKRTI
jgi:hypothetical protein